MILFNKHFVGEISPNNSDSDQDKARMNAVNVPHRATYPCS